MTVYIGFSIRTHKIFARIFCNKFKHCAPVVVTRNKCEIYQFTKRNKITVIRIKKRDLKILKAHGWLFVKYPVKNIQQKATKIHAITCVQFTKKFCRIKNATIQTPDALLKYLTE